MVSKFLPSGAVRPAEGHADGGRRRVGLSQHQLLGLPSVSGGVACKYAERGLITHRHTDAKL